MNTSTYISANNLTVNLTEYSGIILFIGAVTETDQLDSGIMLYHHREPTPFWFFAFCCTVIVLGVILNTLTITVLKMGRRIGKDVKFQLINLAIADLLTACCLPTWYIVNYLMTSSDYVALEAPGYRMCQVIIWVVLGITASSPLLNMLISLERFIVICFPLRARFYTKPLKRFAVAMSWIMAFAGEVYVFAGTGSDDVSEVRSLVEMCRVKINTAAVLVWILIQTSIPTLTIIFCYTCIVIQLCQRQKLGESGSRTYEKSQAKQTREVEYNNIGLKHC